MEESHRIYLNPFKVETTEQNKTPIYRQQMKCVESKKVASSLFKMLYDREKKVEAAGIEPASENGSTNKHYMLSLRLISLPGERRQRLDSQPSKGSQTQRRQMSLLAPSV